jgi:hypothetical protein
MTSRAQYTVTVRLLPSDGEQGWTRYAWLVYLGVLFIHPVSTGRLVDWLTVGAALLLFLPLYFLGYWLSGRRVLRVVAGIVVLGLVLTPSTAAARASSSLARPFSAASTVR